MAESEDPVDQVTDPIIDRLAGDEPFARSCMASTPGSWSQTIEWRSPRRSAELDVSLGNIRGIQFEIERDRPATLVIVPDDPRNVPQVIAVPPEQYDAVGSALAFVGRMIQDGAARA